jgi:hypothetical protein
MLQLLIAHGASINAQNRKQRNTPLHRAARQGKVDCISWLLANGAEPSLATKNKDGETPLAAANSSKATLKPEVRARVQQALAGSDGGGEHLGGEGEGEGEGESDHTGGGSEAVLRPKQRKQVRALDIQTAGTEADGQEEVGDWSCAKSPNWTRLQSQLDTKLGFPAEPSPAADGPLVDTTPPVPLPPLPIAMSGGGGGNGGSGSSARPEWMGATSDINNGLRTNRLLAPMRKALGKKQRQQMNGVGRVVVANKARDSKLPQVS